MEFEKETFITYLEEFSNALGISGHEDAVAHTLVQKFQAQNLFIQRDALGGVYASNVDFSRKTTKKRILISAHLDEVGFLATHICENGLVEVTAVGGVVASSMSGLSMCYEYQGKRYGGIVTAIPAHFAQRQQSQSAEQLSVDFGFSSVIEAQKHGLVAGTPIYFDTTFQRLAQTDRVMGKAMDNRYGCALIALLATSVFHESILHDEIEIVLGATVMEEVGCKGVHAAVQVVQPDFVIALDCSPASDTLGMQQHNGVLGQGVLYRYHDRLMVLPERLKKFLRIIFEKYQIQYQPYISSGTTDASRFLEELQGIPTITCCIPGRYIHNAAAIIDIKDVIEAYKLTLAVVINYKADIHGYLHYMLNEDV